MRFRALPVVVGGMLLGGCATAPTSRPPPLTAESVSVRFTARSLGGAELHAFIAANLGRDPGAAWDFESLSWAAFYLHPSLELARAQWATARAVETTAGVRPNPTLSVTPGYNFTRTAGISPWLPAVNLDFLLPTNGKRERQQAIARSDAEAARLALVTASWQVRSELRRALAEAVTTARRETALRMQADIQRKLVTLLAARNAAGAIAAPEVSLVRAAQLRAEAVANDATGLSLAARVRVAVALGLPVASLEGVALPPPPTVAMLAGEALNAARREALLTRSDLLASLAKYRAAQATLELEIAKQIPDIHLGPGYQWDQGANKWTLALSLELPLFHRNEALIAEAKARCAEAAAQVNIVQAQVVAAVDAAVAAQTAARIQLTNAHRLRAEVTAQNSAVRQRLVAGGADQFQAETAELELATVEATALDAENAVAVASGQLEDALQIPFSHLSELMAAARNQTTPSP